MAIRWMKPKAVAEVVALTATTATGALGAPLAGLPAAASLAIALEAAFRAGVPVHDPPLPARDEAVFLLHTAAEIEHALLVQYLYAAYSLKSAEEIDDDDSQRKKQRQDNVLTWRNTLVSIAKEEMG